MSEQRFGFKSRKPAKEEEKMLFDFPYVEVVPANEKGNITKFRLMNGANEVLSFDSSGHKIAFFQTENTNGRFFLANSTGLPASTFEARINSDFSFNNKALHRRICEDWKLDMREKLWFRIVKADVEGYEDLTVAEIQVIVDVEDVPEMPATANDEPPFEPIDPEAAIGDDVATM